MKNKLIWLIVLLAVILLAETGVMIWLLTGDRSPARPPEAVQALPPQTQPTQPATLPPAPAPSETQPEPTETQPAPTETEPEPTVDRNLVRTTWLMEQMRGELDEELSQLDSKWSVYVEDMQTGYSTRSSQNTSCDDSMISASIVIIFVMACLYERISQGEFEEADLYSTIYQMITVSSNQATNRLIKTLGHNDVAAGLAAVGDYAQSIGCPSTSMHRLMLEENGMQNYVSAVDCAVLLRMIYEGRCISPEYSETMLSILKDQQLHGLIPQGLPEGTLCAHKGGSLGRLCYGDVGIVYNDAGPYIVCIICNDPISDSAANRKIADLARIIDGYMSQRPAVLPD